MSRENDELVRVYPGCCLSMFCGEINCEGCRNYPKLREFKEWVREHEAVVEDEIWAPNVYLATRLEGGEK